LLKHAISGQEEDDVDPHHNHQGFLHTAAYSAHGHPGAAVLILAEIVVLFREGDTNVA